jgi:hypothetical protein
VSTDLFGQGTPIDDVLAHYFPAGDRAGTLGQLVEDEQTLLLAALLMEMRGDSIDVDTTGDETAEYVSRTVTVTDSEDSESWDFTADTVVVWGFDEPVTIAFKAQNTNDREIPLTTGQDPFSLSPPGGLSTSEVWFKLGSGVAGDTTINLLAL